MISKKMEKALNDQVNAELYSAYLYLSMESYFKSLNLNGCANWMRVQTQEEISHAMKIYDFVNERGGRALLKGIEGPPTKWKSPLAVFEAAYAHEQKVTGLINNLVDLAIKEKDHATNSFLQWFAAFVKPLDQVCKNLSVRIALEDVALLNQHVTKHSAVLDYPVVHKGNPRLTVNMRMSIPLRRNAVRRPACMSNPAGSLDVDSAEQVFERADLPGNLLNPYRSIPLYGDAR